MTHAELIDRLGGTRAVAKECGLTDAAVSYWKTRKSGIAWRYRGKLATMAIRHGVEGWELPKDFLTPPIERAQDAA
jgi:predicted transcriptional regulator